MQAPSDRVPEKQAHLKAEVRGRRGVDALVLRRAAKLAVGALDPDRRRAVAWHIDTWLGRDGHARRRGLSERRRQELH